MSTTTETPTRCQCGEILSWEMIEIFKFFPRIEPLCEQCSEDRAETDRALAAIRKEREENEARIRRLEVIPPELLKTDSKHPQFNRQLWKNARDWSRNSYRWLGLIGPAGTCKSRVLAMLAKIEVMAGKRLFWTTATRYQQQVDQVWSDDKEAGKEARNYLKRCQDAEILVFDDIGKNSWNESFERHFFDLVDHRKSHELTTLWSSNNSPIEILESKKISKDRGGPIIGRLIEASQIVHS